mmetsp:Transcript_3178/g.4084  ORF Transcript_3178/g.4084 Transcript_3178/m.4084 type:complete len:104 (-) Transcript_3178:61-372(-)
MISPISFLRLSFLWVWCTFYAIISDSRGDGFTLLKLCIIPKCSSSNLKITATSSGKSLMNEADGNWQMTLDPGNVVFCVILAREVILPTLPFKNGIKGTSSVS